METLPKMFFIGISLLLYSVYGCDVDDYRYEYTECDSAGQRWRVAVPIPGAQCDSLPLPQRAINCSFSCSAGHYLDIATQNCRPCAAGRYSLGGGIRFEEFQTLPPGFSIDNFDEKTDFSSSSGATCPPETGWFVRDSELIYIPSPCVSRLSFSVNLVRPGFVDFSYRMPKNNRALSMSVDIRNQQCQSYREMVQSMLAGRAKADKEESNGDWRRRRLEMKTGSNVISWTVSNSAGLQHPTEPIRFSRIDVIGMAFTRECTLCAAGTYSKEGAAECLPCKAGYYSSKGSRQCGKCPESQYSGHRSEKCFDRPACKQKDFYAVTEPCNSQGKTRTTYKMVQPAICRTDMTGAAKLPPPGPEKECPKCSPGMSKDSSGICQFCEKEHYSDGNECRRCPVDTIPAYGYAFTQWESMPANIRTRCEYISEDVVIECNITSAWLPSGSALVSAPSFERGIALEAIIDVPEGFHDPLAPLGQSLLSDRPIAHFTVVFETTCRDSSCVVYIIEDASPDSRQSALRFLAVFNGTQPRRVWSHAVTKPIPTRFTIAFLRSGASVGDDSITDEARILSINITNVGHHGGKQGGGASECLPCPRGGGGACVPCPPGSFMNPNDHTCSKCPANTVINASIGAAVGAFSCVPCGENLLSSDGVTCASTGLFSVNGSHGPLSYDLKSFLKKQFSVEGVKVFTREGASYFHLFNLTLLGEPVRCEEKFNVEPLLGFDQSKEFVEGSACRLTALPSTGRNVTSLSLVSPTLLASRLAAISVNRTYNGWTLTDQLLEYESATNASLPLDVHFWFETIGAGASESCPRGYSLAVTVRCAPSIKDIRFRLPRSCPDGTCDGCLFSVIAEGAGACPTCRPGDYELIRGECLGGQQTIHFIPSKHCVLTGAAAATRKEACSVLTAREKVLIGIVAGALVALSATLFVVYRRNRRLEYKYTRLVESQTGELPAAETCGLEEDEDEEDRVTFSKGRRLFSRGGREKNDFVPLNNED